MKLSTSRKSPKKQRPDFPVASILEWQIEQIIDPRDALIAFEIGERHRRFPPSLPYLINGRRIARKCPLWHEVRVSHWDADIASGDCDQHERSENNADQGTYQQVDDQSR